MRRPDVFESRRVGNKLEHPLCDYAEPDGDGDATPCGAYPSSSCSASLFPKLKRKEIAMLYKHRIAVDESEVSADLSEIRWADHYHRRVVELETAIRECLKENAHLADGENCTLIGLKRVMGQNPTVDPRPTGIGENP